jgi:hypothetical protein
MQGNGNLGAAGLIQTRFDDHLGGKFHPRTALIKTLIEGFGEAT